MLIETYRCDICGAGVPGVWDDITRLILGHLPHRKRLRAQLAQVTAERDALQAQLDRLHAALPPSADWWIGAAARTASGTKK
jgi:hypothetical protein